MKKVFSNHAEVCHVWAQQCQAEGSATNIYFNGRIIYSYGSHYKIGMFHHSNGDIVLINSSGYSISTAKHTNYVRQAVSHYKTIEVPLVDPQDAWDHTENVKHFLDIIAEAQQKQARARINGEYYIETAQRAGADHNVYIDYFGINHGKDATPAVRVDALFTPEARARVLDQVKQESAKKKEKNRLRALELKENFDAWKAGANIDMWQFRALPMALRLYNGEIQTSHGAKCALDDALLLIDMINTGKDPAGLEFSHYRVTCWRENVLIIGCHRIPRAEVFRFCKMIKCETPA